MPTSSFLTAFNDIRSPSELPGTGLSSERDVGIPVVAKEMVQSILGSDGRGAPTGDGGGNLNGQGSVPQFMTCQASFDGSDPVAIIPPPSPKSVGTTLHPLQEWEGWVTAIRADEFDARLVDLTAGEIDAQEDATIPMEEVAPDDRPMMEVGSMFRVVVGYEKALGGTRKRVFQVVFLDALPVTERDRERGHDWAKWVKESWGVE